MAIKDTHRTYGYFNKFQNQIYTNISLPNLTNVTLNFEFSRTVNLTQESFTLYCLKH